MPLPVDPERLRARFPALTDDDLAAYVEVTAQILATADARGRARLTREVLARGRAAAGKREPLTPEEALARRYVEALAKMQGRIG